MLLGGAGDDVLSPFGDALFLDGGPGNDVLRAPLQITPLRCGSGFDSVLTSTLDFNRTLRLNACERVQLDASTRLTLPDQFGGPTDAFSLSCPALTGRRSCRTTLEARDARARRIAEARRSVTPGRTGRLVLRYRSPRPVRPLRIDITVARTLETGGGPSEVARLTLLP